MYIELYFVQIDYTYATVINQAARRRRRRGVQIYPALHIREHFRTEY